mgnify:CR=1 FL=1
MILTAEALRIVDHYTRAWAAPTVHAWDGMFHPDARFIQPLLRDAPDMQTYHRQVERMLYLAPDLVGTVERVAQDGDTIAIELTLTGTIGGRPISWTLVDLIGVRDGLGTYRRAFFDPTPLAIALCTRPRAWYRWWRSGIWPLTFRQQLPGLRTVPRP